MTTIHNSTGSKSIGSVNAGAGSKVDGGGVKKVTEPKVASLTDADAYASGPIEKPKGGPKIETWQQGIPSMEGLSADYGHGRMEYSGAIHGVDVSVSYPKANSIPSIEFDPNGNIDEQVKLISAQMQALYDPASIPDDTPPAVAKFKDVDVRAMIRKNLDAARITGPFDRDVKIGNRTVNLATAKPGSLTPDELTVGLQEILKDYTFKNVRADVAAFYGVKVSPGSTGSVSGTAALKKLQAVLGEAVELADKYGWGPPMPPAGTERREQYLKAVEAFAIKNLFHGENLVAKHVAQGYDMQKNPDLNENLGHDIIDRSTFAGLIALDENSMASEWKRAWALEEIQKQDPATYQRLVPGGEAPNEAVKKVSAQAVTDAILAKAQGDSMGYTFNPNAGEPRYLLFMYHWGDQRNEADSDMDPHRAVTHHDGDITKKTLNLEQKRQNGIEHHAGTEHEGVRHEAGLGYERGEQMPFEQTIRKIWADGAFRQPFWRQSAYGDIVLQRIMQEAGIITPEQLQHIENPEQYLALDGAYQTLQGANSGADAALGQLKSKLEGVDVALLGRIDGLSNDPARKPSAKALNALIEDTASAATTLSPDQAAALWQYLQAKAIQQSARSVESIELFMPVAAKAAAAVTSLGVPGPARLSTLTTERAVELRRSLEELPQAAKDARAAGDSSLGAVYDAWNDFVTAGFPRVA
jgi:hypothetical protein